MHITLIRPDDADPVVDTEGVPVVAAQSVRHVRKTELAAPEAGRRCEPFSPSVLRQRSFVHARVADPNWWFRPKRASCLLRPNFGRR